MQIESFIQTIQEFHEQFRNRKRATLFRMTDGLPDPINYSCLTYDQHLSTGKALETGPKDARQGQGPSRLGLQPRAVAPIFSMEKVMRQDANFGHSPKNL